MSGIKNYLEDKATKLSDYIMSFAEGEINRIDVLDVCYLLAFSGRDFGADHYQDLLIYYTEYLPRPLYKLYATLFILDFLDKIEEFPDDQRGALLVLASEEKDRILKNMAFALRKYSDIEHD